MRTTEGGTRTQGKGEVYRCFLVRCRLEGNGQAGGPPAWRFTVQQAGGSGARHSFTCFDDVAAHMRAELASCGALAADGTEPGAATQGRPYHGPCNGRNGAEERRQEE